MIDGDLTTIAMMINLYRFLTTSVTSSILWISLSECMKVNIIDLSHSVRTKKQFYQSSSGRFQIPLIRVMRYPGYLMRTTNGLQAFKISIQVDDLALGYIL